jgi:hypothetical protein
MAELVFDYWDQVDKDIFLASDRDNPARAFVANWVSDFCRHNEGRVMPTMLEVGPGPGIDYERFYRNMVKSGMLGYAMIDGSAGMCDFLRKKFPEAMVATATFENLVEGGTDIVYTKALFEHQPELETPLRQFLAAGKRLAIVNWYRPPADEEVFTVGKDKCIYATWKREDVLRIGRECGWGEPEITAFDNGNEVWIWRKAAIETKPASKKRRRK